MHFIDVSEYNNIIIYVYYNILDANKIVMWSYTCRATTRITETVVKRKSEERAGRHRGMWSPDFVLLKNVVDSAAIVKWRFPKLLETPTMRHGDKTEKSKSVNKYVSWVVHLCYVKKFFLLGVCFLFRILYGPLILSMFNNETIVK